MGEVLALISLLGGVGGCLGVGALFVKVGGYKARLERTERDIVQQKSELDAFKAAQAVAEKDLRRELLERMDKVEDKLDKLILMLGKSG